MFFFNEKKNIDDFRVVHYTVATCINIYYYINKVEALNE